MKFNAVSVVMILLILVTGCKTPEARRPVDVKTGSYISESAERNKKWHAQEEEEIKAVMEKDTVAYIASEYGFWYHYEIENPDTEETAGFGDKVEFEYNVRDLYGNLIYSKEELGKQTYHMDREELFTGLREGLKIMKEGETVTFVFPSFKAYGYYGDFEKIGVNMPIVTTVTVTNIEQIN